LNDKQLRHHCALQPLSNNPSKDEYLSGMALLAMCKKTGRAKLQKVKKLINWEVNKDDGEFNL